MSDNRPRMPWGVFRRPRSNPSVAKRRRQGRPLREGAIFIGAVALILYLGFVYGVERSLPIPLIGNGETLVKAQFAEAPSLRTGDPVRVAGIEVGEVDRVDLAEGGESVLVTMALTGGDRSPVLREDARASIWWRTLLGGNTFVDLDLGSPSGELLGDQTIPMSRTQSQVEFDQLLQPVDSDARRGLRAMIAAFDEGFENTGALKETVSSLAPSMRELGPAVSAARGLEEGDLTAMIGGLSRTMGGLARSEADLAGLVENADVALAAVAARRSDLGGFLREAPAALADTERTMIRLRETTDLVDRLAPRLQPGARELAPAARDAEDALEQARPVLADARPLLADLDPALGRLGKTSVRGESLVEGLDPTLERTRSEFLPWLYRRDGDTRLRNFQAIGPMLSVIDSATSNYDIYGHLLRFQGAGGGERSLTPLGCQTYFTDPTSDRRVTCDALDEALGGLFGPAQEVGEKDGG